MRPLIQSEDKLDRSTTHRGDLVLEAFGIENTGLLPLQE